MEPWRQLPSRDCDRFALVWESACLKELGSAVGMFIAQQALQQVSLGGPAIKNDDLWAADMLVMMVLEGMGEG